MICSFSLLNELDGQVQELAGRVIRVDYATERSPAVGGGFRGGSSSFGGAPRGGRRDEQGDGDGGFNGGNWRGL